MRGRPRTTTAKRPRMTRADKLEATRKALLAAAARVVGRDGYADASVAKITALAKVAQGTFYNYFPTQQDLFDQLLPTLGDQLLDSIRERLENCPDSLEREERRFRAFFDYLCETPEFYRILNEAEVVSPKAYLDHMANMADSYMRAFRRDRQAGELSGYDPRELEVIIYILLAARNYLAYRYTYRDGRAGPVPEWVVRTYMRFVSGGFNAARAERGAKRRRRPTGADAAASPLVLAEIGEVRVLSVGDGRAAVEMDIRPEHRDERGQVRRHVILGLLDAAGGLAAGGLARPAEAASLTSHFIAPTAASRLFARASCENRNEALAQVTLRASEQNDHGPAVATGQAVFAIAPRPADSPRRSAKD